MTTKDLQEGVRKRSIVLSFAVDGDFTLPNVPSSAKTLVISFVGMQTQEVTIKPHVKVILKSDSELLEEVVVTGYGTFKKASFTGAASTVNTSTLEDVPVLSVADKLSGNVAGVTFGSSSSNPCTWYGFHQCRKQSALCY